MVSYYNTYCILIKLILILGISTERSYSGFMNCKMYYHYHGRSKKKKKTSSTVSMSEEKPPFLLIRVLSYVVFRLFMSD
jgi:hypothetical protein